MKLIPAALALLFAFAGTVQAGETEFSYDARIDSLYGYNFPANKYKHRDHRGHWVNTFYLNTAIEHSFNNDYSASLHLDLMAGINKRQDNFNNGDWGQEVYGIFDTPFGRLMLGETYNVAAQFHVGAPSAGAFGLNDSDVVNYLDNPNWVKTKHETAYRTLNSTTMNTDGVAAKISYISPEFYQTYFGFTFTPDSYDRRGLVNKFAPYADDKAYVFSLYHERDLGFADLSASLGYGIFNQDDKELTAGLSLYKGGWTVGGSYRKTYVDGGDFPVAKSSDNPRLPELFDNYREGQAWDIGVGYEIGPYKVALSYLRSKADNTDNRDEIILLSNQYQLNKNIDLYLAGAQVNFRGADKDLDDNNKGYAVMAGVGLHF